MADRTELKEFNLNAHNADNNDVLMFHVPGLMQVTMSRIRMYVKYATVKTFRVPRSEIRNTPSNFENDLRCLLR